MPRDEFHVYTDDKGLTAIFPYRDKRSRIIATFPVGTMPPEGDPTLREVQELLAERGPKGAIVSDPIWFSRFKISRRMVDRMRQGHVFLAGDAAHIHSPAGGQGMNTGIQDSHNLAWKLALVLKGQASVSLLDSYHEERHEVAASVIRGTDFLTKIVTFQNPIARSIRDNIAPLVTGLDIVQQRISRSVSELSVDYRKSPAVQTHGMRPFGMGIVAGCRAPQASVQSMGAGTLFDIQELFRSKSHVLLLFAGAEPTEGSQERLRDLYTSATTQWSDLMDAYAIDSGGSLRSVGAPVEQVLGDPGGDCHAAYGVSTDTVVLVRPDGYIGYWAAPIDAPAFRAYLASLYNLPG